MNKFELIDKLAVDVKNHRANEHHGMPIEEVKVFLEALEDTKTEDKIRLELIEDLINSNMPPENVLVAIKHILG